MYFELLSMYMEEQKDYLSIHLSNDVAGQLFLFANWLDNRDTKGKIMKRPIALVSLSKTYPEVEELANSYEMACLNLERASRRNIYLKLSFLLNVLLLLFLIMKMI